MPQRDRRGRRAARPRPAGPGPHSASSPPSSSSTSTRIWPRSGSAPPALQPRAHAYIGQVIALAAGLLARDAAYQRDGYVYFRGASAAGRAGLDRATALQLASEYGDHPDDARKDDPFDVAIWQASTGDQPAWQSPWGPRPGWHAECAAMAAALVRPGGQRPGRRRRPALPASRLPGRGGRGADRGHPVRPGPAQRRRGPGERGQDGQVGRQPGADQLAARGVPRGKRSAADSGPEVGRGLGLRPGRAGCGRGAAGAAAGRGRAAGPDGARPRGTAAVDAVRAALASDLDVPAALRIAEENGGQAARVLGSLLGLW